MDYRTEAPPILRDFLVYHETIQAHSKKTVDEYYLDLRGFFRYLKLERRIVPADTPMEQIAVDDVDLELVPCLCSSLEFLTLPQFITFITSKKLFRCFRDECFTTSF